MVEQRYKEWRNLPRAEEPPVGLVVTLPMFKWGCDVVQWAGSFQVAAIKSAETVSGGRVLVNVTRGILYIHYSVHSCRVLHTDTP